MSESIASNRCTVIESIGIANPPYMGTQNAAADFMLRFECLSDSVRARIPAIYARSGIDRRFTCVGDYLREYPEFEFFPRNASCQPPPSTAARNLIYREWAPRVALDAAVDALSRAGCAGADITHLIVVSCTGFFAPGVDFHLIKDLNLDPSTPRTVIGFMGCCAAFNGLKAADAICRSDANARVLLVCVELCTLHFVLDDTLESAVINAIFADGGAAVVLSSASSEDASGRLAIADARSVIDNDSMEAMTWDIGDTGFAMGLSARIPSIVAKHLPQYVDRMLAANNLERTDIDFWAIHPGGRQILDRARDVLCLAPEYLADSYAVLREYGNMSSPTILFILRRMLDQRDAAKSNGAIGPQTTLAMAFGPGLTIEGCLLRTMP